MGSPVGAPTRKPWAVLDSKRNVERRSPGNRKAYEVGSRERQVRLGVRERDPARLRALGSGSDAASGRLSDRLGQHFEPLSDALMLTREGMPASKAIAGRVFVRAARYRSTSALAFAGLVIASWRSSAQDGLRLHHSFAAIAGIPGLFHRSFGTDEPACLCS